VEGSAGMRETLDDIWLSVKNIAFPQFCKSCDERLLTEEIPFFCPNCWEVSPRIEPPFCSISGQPHEGAVGYGFREEFPSAEWRAITEAQRGFYRLYGAAVYDDAVAEAIKLLKFRGKQRIVPHLAELMKEFAEKCMAAERYDFLIPVPLYKVRQRERGFNQALLLAEAILPAFTNATLDITLARIRPTLSQSRAENPAERRKNIQGAFAVPGDAAHLTGKTVLLIDDVVTTAATVIECAHALKAAGVTRVDGFACALAKRNTA